jgi:hypothetical protein
MDLDARLGVPTRLPARVDTRQCQRRRAPSANTSGSHPAPRPRSGLVAGRLGVRDRCRLGRLLRAAEVDSCEEIEERVDEPRLLGRTRIEGHVHDRDRRPALHFQSVWGKETRFGRAARAGGRSVAPTSRAEDSLKPPGIRYAVGGERGPGRDALTSRPSPSTWLSDERAGLLFGVRREHAIDATAAAAKAVGVG